MDSLRRNLARACGAVFAVAIVVGALAHGHHVQFFCDDSYISYRYAQNLASGHGLVFNPGERVEGYTNFLWVILISAGLKMGLPAEGFSLALGIVALLGILVVTFLLARRLLGSWVALAAPAFVAASGPVVLWSTSGLESGLFAAFVLLSMHLYENGRHSRRALLASGLLYALSAMVRPDGIVFGGVAGLMWLLEGLGAARGAEAGSSSRTWRREFLVRGALLAGGFLVVFVPFMLWRHSYYGDWLPNTFYVKASSAIQIDLGRAYVASFAREYWVLVLLAGAGAGVALLAPLGRAQRATACHYALAMTGFFGYVGWAGGDYMALYRFMIALVPMLAIFAAVLLHSLFVQGLLRLDAVRRMPEPARLLGAALVVALLSATQLPPTFSSMRGERPIESISAQSGMKRNAFLWSKAGQTLRRLPADTWIATTAAGAIPFWSMLPTIDQSGLCDRYTAKVESDPWLLDRPGHHRQATKKHLMERKPHVILWHPQIMGLNSTLVQNPFDDYLLRSMAIEGLRPEGQQQFLYFYLRKDLDRAYRSFGVKPLK